MDIKDIILIVFGIIIVYLFYKTKQHEKFETSYETIINDSINNKYSANLNYIRDLSNLTDNLMDNNDITLNETISYYNNLTIDNLTVNGNVDFMNKDTAYLNILPRYVIIPWYKITTDGEQLDIPKGWALCDGRIYKLNEKKEVVYVEENLSSINISSSGDIKTPDLRGKFILGAGIGFDPINNKILTNRVVKTTGGEENVLLTVDNLPKHSHNASSKFYMWGIGPKNIAYTGGDDSAFGGRQKTGDTGGIKQDNGEYLVSPHNNMPPYYALYYIIKL